MGHIVNFIDKKLLSLRSNRLRTQRVSRTLKLYSKFHGERTDKYKRIRYTLSNHEFNHVNPQRFSTDLRDKQCDGIFAKVAWE